MKRDDLFTKLHDQYNTFSFSIQDPEAFHHDVYEISRDADTPDDFHRLMADRQRQRLQELHESLETLAVEIIANPKLMDSEHWNYAIQLFRTKSFDSIVRYFASYLPDEYLDRHDDVSSSTTSFSDAQSVDTASTTTSSVADEAPRFFSDKNVMTKEPLSIHTNIRPSDVIDGPLSPPQSEVAMSDSHPSSPTDSDSRAFSSRAPSRSMSFSDSEAAAFESRLSRPHLHDDETSDSGDSDAAASSVTFDCGSSTISDAAESRSSIDTFDEKGREFDYPDDEDEFPTAQFPEDAFDMFDTLTDDDTPESETPTPREETVASCYIEYKSSASRRIPPSPYRRSHSPTPKPYTACRREENFPKENKRSPDESLSKIQKPLPLKRRNWQKDRRRLD